MAITVGVAAACAAPVDGAVVATTLFTATADRLISAEYSGEPDSGSLTSVTLADVGTNSYTASGAIVGSGGRKARGQWTRNATSSAIFAVTATMPGAVPVYGFSIHIQEGVGVKASGNPVNLYGGRSQDITGAEGANNQSTGAQGTPSVDGCWEHALAASGSFPDNFNAGTGYTTTGLTPNNPSTRSEYKIQTTATAVDATFSNDLSGNVVTVVTVFEPETGGGSTDTPNTKRLGGIPFGRGDSGLFGPQRF